MTVNGKVIKDEFTDLPVSRQRKYQLRMKRDKRCPICGEPVAVSSFCVKHWVERREIARKKLGLKRRYYRAFSYQLEAMAKASARKKRSQKKSR